MPVIELTVVPRSKRQAVDRELYSGTRARENASGRPACVREPPNAQAIIICR
jgi:hypothetical protein